MAKMASIPLAKLGKVCVEQLNAPSITINTVMEIEIAICWMDPIKMYLQTGVLPGDLIEAKRIERRSSKFIHYEGKLLCKSIVNTDIHLFLQYRHPDEAELALI